MSRPLSLTGVASIAAQETGEVWVALLKLTHLSLPEPICVSSDNAVLQGGERGTLHGGVLYTFCPFSLNLPEETDQRPPETTLTIDNVSREIVAAIRTIPTAPDLELKIVLASTPDTVEAGPFNFTLDQADWDAFVVSGKLAYERILDEDWPTDEFVPATHPGLF